MTVEEGHEVVNLSFRKIAVFESGCGNGYTCRLVSRRQRYCCERLGDMQAVARPCYRPECPADNLSLMIESLVGV